VQTIEQSVVEKLRSRIRSEGSITFRDWMETALYDSSGGYYCRLDRTPWGRYGDYRTSAERSSLFSATFARYFARLYSDLSCPQPLTIVDCGAGAGDFARGVLATLKPNSPDLATNVRYIVDERSTRFRQIAQQQPTDFVIEFESLKAMPPINAGIIFANELLDAFPVHRVMQKDGVLQEFYVRLDANEKFEWTLSAPSTSELIDYFNSAGVTLQEGRIAEVNLEAGTWLRTVSEKLQSGFLIIVDYGAEADELFGSTERRNGTLRSFRSHHLEEDVLSTPGDQDLTTTVDWTFVKKLSSDLGFEVVCFQRQDKFLLEAGLLEELGFRTAVLSDEADRIRLRTEAREMVLPTGMAGSFQVLVLKKQHT
jgi:SAM-dependent MidA family methyltransferase